MSFAFRFWLVLVQLAIWSTSATTSFAQPKPLPDNVELTRDVEYGKGGGRPLTMHILRPKKVPQDKMPVIVWIHGGGWEGGSKDGGINRLASFAERGYFCATIGYRFSGEAIFPAQIEDAKCAIRFLRANAKTYHLDPQRIGAWGYSAGGHLVELLGTSGQVKELEGEGGWPEFSSQVQAVCSVAGVGDFVKWGDKAHPAVVKLLGGIVSKNMEKAALASPVTHVGKGMPPFLIIHGDKDMTVPVAQSEYMHAALQKVGADVTLNVIQGGSHNLINPETDKLAETFFDKHLLGKSKKAEK